MSNHKAAVVTTLLILIATLTVPATRAGKGARGHAVRPPGAPAVEVCHVPLGNLANAHTIRVAEAAVAAHLAHGDTVGPCPGPCSLSAPPVVVRQPIPLTTLAGGEVVFTVLAEGEALDYRWRRNGARLTDESGMSGTTADVLIIDRAVLDDEGDYSVEIANCAGRVVSEAARLDVDLPRAGDPDLTFRPPLGFHGEVHVARALPDGGALVGGSFSFVESVPRGNLARFRSDGSFDHAFWDGSSGADGPVRFIELQADGKILIAGDFSSVDGFARGRIARLYRDGRVDPDFRGAIDDDDILNVIASQPDGRVLMGGRFEVGGAHVSVIRLLPNGEVDPTFRDGLSGPDREVFDLSVLPDGGIVVAGEGLLREGTGSDGGSLAKLHADGLPDQGFLDPIENCRRKCVLQVIAQPDGRIVIGGDFGIVDGRRQGGLARLEPNGRLDEEFFADGNSGWVHDLASYEDGRFLAAGSFGCPPWIDDCGGYYRPETIFRVSSQGVPDPAISYYWDSRWREVGRVVSIDIGPDDRILLVETDSGAPRVSWLTTRGFTDERILDDGGIGGGHVLDLARDPHGQLALARTFTRGFASRDRGYAIRMQPDGSLDPTYSPSVWARFDWVEGLTAIAVRPDRRAFFAGEVFRWSHRVGRLAPEGSVEFSTQREDVLRYYYGLEARPGGDCLAYGASYREGPAMRLLTPQLEIDPAFEAVIAPDCWVRHAETRADGSIVAAGSCGVVVLRADGSLDAGFDAEVSPYVLDFARLPDEGLLIAGGFGVARLEPDGSLDTTFPAPGLDGRVEDVVIAEDGSILASGRFRQVNGAPAARLVRLYGDGSLATAFYPDDRIGLENLHTHSSTTSRLLLLDDGTIVIHGRFDLAFGAPAPGIVRVLGRDPVSPRVDVSPADTVACAGATVELAVQASGTPRSYRWFKDGELLGERVDVIGTQHHTLTIGPVLPEHAGTYSVTVWNVLGEDVSSPAVLDVVSDCGSASASHASGEVSPMSKSETEHRMAR